MPAREESRLGFSLEQVRAVLAEKVSAAELRGMFKLRRAELYAQIEAGTARLARIEARLRTFRYNGFRYNGFRYNGFRDAGNRRTGPAAVPGDKRAGSHGRDSRVRSAVRGVVRMAQLPRGRPGRPAVLPLQRHGHGRSTGHGSGSTSGHRDEGNGVVVAGVVPAGRYAAATHVGHPQELMMATKELLDWGSAQGLKWDMSAGDGGERWGSRLEILT